MDYLIHLATFVSIYAILALSLNLVVGFTGLLSVAHAAFYGIGAYTVAILMTKLGWNFFAALAIGMALAALAAFLIGPVLSKFRDDYYALASLGFGVIVYSVFLNSQDLTRGPLGIPGIPRPSLFGFSLSENFLFLIFAILAALAVYFLCVYISRSSFGRVLTAVREDEEALRVFGYRTPHFKLAVFVLSAALAAVSGALYASYISFIDPSTFTIGESIFLIAIIILGGLASNRGAVIGALTLVILPELLRFVGFPADTAAQMRQLVYGVLLVLLMMKRPQGLVGEYKL